jgi:hypothetical protein
LSPYPVFPDFMKIGFSLIPTSLFLRIFDSQISSPHENSKPIKRRAWNHLVCIAGHHHLDLDFKFVERRSS